ncbi:MAG: sulfatase-like hydrolase/transferase [Ginsengibacter sp.]
MILLLLISFHAFSQKTSKANKPNIVYIFAHDLGYGDLGCYGQKKIETPNIDALAKEGMKFTQHYAMPVCAPSRYCLMTGINSGKAIYPRQRQMEYEKNALATFCIMMRCAKRKFIGYSSELLL